MKTMRIIGLLLALWMPLWLPAQTMKDVFLAMPDTLLPALTANDRADFVDFLDSHMRAQVKNRLGQPSEMLALTADYLLLQTSAAATMQLKLLPLTDSTRVVCCVRTYAGPAADSQLMFYTPQWQPLSSDGLFAPPAPADYLLPLDSLVLLPQSDALYAADLPLFRFDLDPSAPMLRATYTTPDYLDSSTADDLRRCLRCGVLAYVWRGGRFVRED